MLKPLLNSAPRTTPLIRVYVNYISFNEPAARLLELKKGDSVSIMADDRSGYIYVANAVTKQSYALTCRNNTYKVSNRRLCRKLAESLEGFGSYKIIREDNQEFMGNIYYNIFKRKYGED